MSTVTDFLFCFVIKKGHQKRSCFKERGMTSVWREGGQGGGERRKDRDGRRDCKRIGKTAW